ncbi:MAG: septum site-determining protein MinC [Azoarcus sp.]|jgi:septum site-determining protein MinC|nr:septum site-determining protein MinC [Azoarcus sp.]
MTRPSPSRSIEFHNTSLEAVLVSLNRTDPAGLADEMHKMLGGKPGVFNREAAILDFSAIEASGAIDWNGLLSLLRRYGLQPVGTRGLSDEAQIAGARRVGLADFDASPATAEAKPVAKSAPPPPPVSGPSSPTLYIDKPVRSGQQIYAQGGDLVLLAGISPGSEVIADGNIHCFGPLAGRALAGARGNTEARIIATCFGPELVAVAGVYRTFERGVPDIIAGGAVVVRMKSSAKNQSIVIDPLKI